MPESYKPILLPSGQDWLIQLATSLGYEIDKDGFCHGIACMGMQAILSEDIKSLKNRLIVIQQVFINTAARFSTTNENEEIA